jgi:hypothetical protein
MNSNNNNLISHCELNYIEEKLKKRDENTHEQLSNDKLNEKDEKKLLSKNSYSKLRNIN